MPNDEYYHIDLDLSQPNWFDGLTCAVPTPFYFHSRFRPERDRRYISDILRNYRGRKTKRVVANSRYLLTETPVIGNYILELIDPPPPDRTVFAVVAIECCWRPVWMQKFVAWREFDSLDAALDSLDKSARDRLVFSSA
jgi:hypothetical protein